jgi:hypothetical protein
MLLLKILGGVLALGIGVYLGMAGQYRPDPDDLEQALGPGGRSRKARRRFTLFGWLRMPEERSSHKRRRGGGRRHFDLVATEPPKKEE